MEAEDDFERVISEMAELLVPHTPTTAHFKLHTRPPGSSTVVIVDDYLSIQTTESLEDVHTHIFLYQKALGKGSHLSDLENGFVDDN